MYINGDSSEDARLKWRNTVLGIRENEKIVPFLVANPFIDDRNNRVELEGHKLINGNWENYLTHSDNDALVIEKPFPSFINQGKELYYYSWRNRRSAKKGICSESCEIIRVSYKGGRLPTHHDITSINADIYTSIYNPIYYPLNTIINFIMRKEKFGAPLNADYGVGISMTVKFCSLFCKNVLIGEIDKDRIVHLLKENKHHTKILNNLGLEVKK